MFRVFLRIGGTFLVEMGIFVLNCKRLEHLVMRPILTSNTSRGLFEQLCCEYWCMVYTHLLIVERTSFKQRIDARYGSCEGDHQHNLVVHFGAAFI